MIKEGSVPWEEGPEEEEGNGGDEWGVFENNGYHLAAPQWETETRPECSGTNGTDDCGDSSLEEIFHLVTAMGYAEAFPSTWGEKMSMSLTFPPSFNLYPFNGVLLLPNISIVILFIYNDCCVL